MPRYSDLAKSYSMGYEGILDLCEANKQMFPIINLETPAEVEALSLAAEELITRLRAKSNKPYICTALMSIGDFIGPDDVDGVTAATQKLRKVIARVLSFEQCELTLAEFMAERSTTFRIPLTNEAKYFMRLFWIDHIMENQHVFSANPD